MKDIIKSKKNLKNAKEAINFYHCYIAAPHYRLEIVSKDYLDAENILSDVLEVIEAKVEKHNGVFEFIRD